MNSALELGCAAEPALADAFAAFTAAAGRLEFSYQQLQSEVARLREELEERNAALTSSLAENEKMRLALARILEALPCGVVVLEDGNRVGFMNPEATRLLESTDGPAGNEITRALLARVQRAERHEQELCIRNGDKKRWIVVRSAGVYGTGLNSSEALSGAAAQETVLILRDITLQRQMESEREKTRGLIALAEMSSVLAHEIRNPLGSLELLTGLLMSSPEIGPEQKQWVEHLQAGLRSLSGTVNNVLRTHAMGAPILVPLNLAAVLREAVSFIRPLAEQTGIVISLEESLHAAEIAGNAGELQQVILNLALNAFRHTDAMGQVKIAGSLQQQGSRKIAVVEFIDNGRGIPPENLERVFESGFSTSGHSPGLGLAVSRKIVQQHGGSIAVSSQAGSGTTFRMEFPTL
jgi:signal transduction histidine kinase